ncbi:transcriptional regulator, LysR family [Primorskyibacter flagellatus]|uniref:Transcriptional regulator, LysR family n=2 Tax=Primorskyibacter flagellatus TaxID=1387277 RepID=A0A1W2BYF8_9RHOB|nr:transcriptional regulator, LysR family [Primorskyibacter flagellatus]
MHDCMDWRNVNFDWNRARAFLVTAEEGSLSAAARALGVAQPTLGRQVTALEEELGVTLFERVPRGLELTTAGLDLVEHVRAMGDAANRVSLAATGQSVTVEGQITITASEIYSAYLLPPILARLREMAPGIEVEVVASNTIRDLKKREADIAIRNARPTQPDLIGKLVAEDHATIYATPSYLQSLGDPQSPEDLKDADFIGLENLDQLIEGLNAQGFDLARRNFPIQTENHLVHWQMARHGLGIGIGPCHLGDRDPGLARVLPEAEPIRFPIWLVAHRELQTSRRVRLVYDLLAEELPTLLGD